MQQKEIKKKTFHHVRGLLKRILPTFILVIGLDWMSACILQLQHAGLQQPSGCDTLLPPALMMCGWDSTDTSHMYTEALYFSHPLAKSNLLRPFYDSLTKLRSMEITFPWLDIPLSRSSRPALGDKAGLRRMPGTDRSCGSSESVAFQRVKAWHISHKCSLNSLSS